MINTCLAIETDRFPLTSLTRSVPSARLICCGVMAIKSIASIVMLYFSWTPTCSHFRFCSFNVKQDLSIIWSLSEYVGVVSWICQEWTTKFNKIKHSLSSYVVICYHKLRYSEWKFNYRVWLRFTVGYFVSMVLRLALRSSNSIRYCSIWRVN